MAAHNGTIRYQDLRSYKAIERDSVKGTFRGNTILSMPPSSSGGVTLIEMLNIFETHPAQLGYEGSAEQRHYMIESMRRAYRDRAGFSGDPGFITIPVEMLTSKEHAAERAKTISPDHATPSGAGGPAQPAGGSGGELRLDSPGYESEDTTHFAVIDEAGNIVSNT